MNVWPATVIVPVRSAPGFAATLKVRAPLPLPFAADVIVIHAALLLPVHLQPPLVVTLIELPPPPVAPIDWLFESIE